MHQVTGDGYTGINPNVSTKHKLIQYFISQRSGMCSTYKEDPLRIICKVDGNMIREEMTASNTVVEKEKMRLNCLCAAKFTMKANENENAKA